MRCTLSKLERFSALLAFRAWANLGLLLAEALSLHKTSIATDYSGSCDFLCVGNSLLVPCTLVPVDSGNLNYRGYAGAVWAEPSADAASQAMVLAADKCGEGL